MIKSVFNNKSILITGGTGSFGFNFAKEILLKYKPKKIVIYSRDEYKQYKMQNSEIFKRFINNKNQSNSLRFFIKKYGYTGVQWPPTPIPGSSICVSPSVFVTSNTSRKSIPTFCENRARRLDNPIVISL